MSVGEGRPNRDHPKVSVKMVTFNHEPFIGQALDGVLMQKVNFPYEIVVGEDCSTDRTRKILLEYQRRHPDKICLLLNEKNMGRRYNARHTLFSCRGDYIAILDGDDYWTDENKLQKQIDFLDNHPDCTICFHNAKKVFENGNKSRIYHKEPFKEILILEDIIEQNIMPSCSMVFRNRIFNAFPKIFDSVPFGDWPMQVLCAEKGNIGYIHEVMGVHRFHSGGVWTAGGVHSSDLIIRQRQWLILFFKALDVYLQHQYHHKIMNQIALNHNVIKSARIGKMKEKLKVVFPSLYRIYRFLKK